MSPPRSMDSVAVLDSLFYAVTQNGERKFSDQHVEFELLRVHKVLCLCAMLDQIATTASLSCGSSSVLFYEATPVYMGGSRRAGWIIQRRARGALERR